MEKVLIWPDTHFPHEDKRKVAQMMKIVKDWKPEHLVFLGDLDDMSSPSRWVEGTPTEYTARVSVTGTATGEFLKEIRDILPDAKIDYFEGNHEVRLTEYVSKNAPALDGLIDIPKLFDLDNLGISFYRYREPPVKLIGDFYVHHGSSVSKHAGQSAKGEADSYGVSGFSGHTHRLGVFHQRFLDGREVSWYECGHLTDPAQHSYNQHYNWQSGYAYAYVDRGRVYPFLSKFIGNTVVHDGKKYS